MGGRGSDGGVGGTGGGVWSWEENKLFELALAVVDQKDPKRWEAVASMVKGKSAVEVERHYAMLLEDVESIESGKLDHKFADGCKLSSSLGRIMLAKNLSL